MRCCAVSIPSNVAEGVNRQGSDTHRDTMKTISLRGVEDETARKLTEEAVQRGTSVNTLILQFINAGMGMKVPAKKHQEYHDLDQLAGTWTEEDSADLMGAISGFEHIDKELWGETETPGH